MKAEGTEDGAERGEGEGGCGASGCWAELTRTAGEAEGGYGSGVLGARGDVCGACGVQEVVDGVVKVSYISLANPTNIMSLK